MLRTCIVNVLGRDARAQAGRTCARRSTRRPAARVAAAGLPTPAALSTRVNDFDISHGSAMGYRSTDPPAVQQFRQTLSKWVAAEVTPNIAAWDEAGEFPLGLYKAAADVGLLGAGYPERLGGVGEGDLRLLLTAWDAITEAGSGGLGASLGSHGIAIPPIVAHGSEDLQERVVPPVLAGEKVAALAITEPSGGSDVASIRTTARCV